MVKKITKTIQMKKSRRSISERYTRYLLPVIIVLLLLCASVIVLLMHIQHTVATQKHLSFNTKTTLLMRIPGDCDIYGGRIFISETGRDIAYSCSFIKNDYDVNQLIVNGIRQNVLGTINPTNVSIDPQTGRFAYFVQCGNENSFNPNNCSDIVIDNGKVIGKYRSGSVSTLRNNQQYLNLLIGGKTAFTTQPDSNGYDNFIFDGKIISSQNNNKPYRVFSPAVSADGSTYAFETGTDTGNTAILVENGRETPIGKGTICAILLGPHGNHIAYIFQTEINKQHVVYDNSVGKNYDSIDDVDNFFMSPDGEHIAYRATQDGKDFWVVDATEYRQYAPIGDTFIFSPDSKHFAFTVIDPSHPHEEALIVDGAISDSYDTISNPVYSGDGKTVAFFASQNNKSFLIKNHAAFPLIVAYPDQTASDLTVSKDGKVVAYKVGDYSAHQNIVINGKLSQNYETLATPLYLSKDNRYIGFGVQNGRNIWWVVTDLTKQHTPNPIPTEPTNTPLPTPTVTSTIATPAPTIAYNTFTSNDLGISFTYNPSVGGAQNLSAGEEGNTAYLIVSGIPPKEGFRVEEFQKDPRDSLGDAIKKQFLQNTPATDCQIVVSQQKSGENKFEGSTYQSATIQIPQLNIPEDMETRNARIARCPSGYTYTGNGVNYFLYNSDKPDKYVFVYVGQSDVSGEDGYLWDQTIKIF